MKRLTRREKRAKINAMLDKVMKRPVLPEAILPSVRLQRNLDAANLARRQIESKYKTKEVLYKELKQALARNAAKTEVRKIKMKLKMNNLPTILEDSADHLDMSEQDADKLFQLNDEIMKLEIEKKANEESDPVLNQMKIDAELVIENEMQFRRDEYIMQKKRDYMLKTVEEMTLLREVSGGKKFNKKIKSIFDPPKGRKIETEKDKADAMVPKELQKWIFRPEIAERFNKQARK